MAVHMRLGEDRAPPVEERRHTMRQMIPFAERGFLAVEGRKLHAHLAILLRPNGWAVLLGEVMHRGRTG